jgi:opacity protein-like surface antigen
MKNSPLMLLSMSLAFAGAAAAATPKKPPSYNQNRVGPYAVGMVGNTSYTGDQAASEDFLLDFMTQGSPAQNLQSSSDDTDLGYQVKFGYRFHRYFAAEFSLVQFGDLTTKASGDVDYDNVGQFQPVTAKFKFHPNGFMLSALGILPVGEKFELFGRLGYLFSSVEREVGIRSEGETLFAGSFSDDAQEVLYGVGLAFNLNQVYSLRAEYQFADKVGSSEIGTEDLNFLSLGLQMRF